MKTKIKCNCIVAIDAVIISSLKMFSFVWNGNIFLFYLNLIINIESGKTVRVHFDDIQVLVSTLVWQYGQFHHLIKRKFKKNCTINQSFMSYFAKLLKINNIDETYFSIHRKHNKLFQLQNTTFIVIVLSHGDIIQP